MIEILGIEWTYLHNNNGNYTTDNKEQEKHDALISSHLIIRGKTSAPWHRFLVKWKTASHRGHKNEPTCLPISFTSWEAFLIENWIESRSLTILPICSVCKISKQKKEVKLVIKNKNNWLITYILLFWSIICKSKLTWPFNVVAVWVPTSIVWCTTYNKIQWIKNKSTETMEQLKNQMTPA